MNTSSYKHSLKGVDFGETKLENVDFSGFDLQGANFSKATLVNVNFTGANLDSAEFWMASLYNIDFTNTNLNNVSFALTREIQNVKIGGNSLDDFLLCPWSEDFISFEVINHEISLIDVYRKPGDINDSWDIVHQQEDGTFARIPNAGYGEEATGRIIENLRPEYIVEFRIQQNINGHTKRETLILANNLLIASATH
jgi:Pentapeptide repeats (9 copies)